MQVTAFGQGRGACAHKIKLDHKAGQFSAWFDESGAILDAEHYDCRWRRRSVAFNGPSWKALAALGGTVISIARQQVAS